MKFSIFNRQFLINLRSFRLNLDRVVIFVGAVAVILFIVFWFWWRGGGQISIINESRDNEIDFPKSSIAGLSCSNYNRRPMAVMISSDGETRPLSGISSADIVFEMPVTPGGVTRMMAVYQCFEPVEIGSIRSARNDFISLAAALDSIFVHWGGEKEALRKLDARIIDNIDALRYEQAYFYRKTGIKQPHNGFADFQNLWKAVEKFDYGKENSFVGYLHGKNPKPSNILNLVSEISIDYPYPFNIKWVYDEEGGQYKRFRGDKPEIDRNNSSQVESSVIVVMKTKSKYVSKDYMDVIVVGEGEAEIYQNGVKISGRWKKDPDVLGSKLFFYDAEGKEAVLIPGSIWVEIVTND